MSWGRELPWDRRSKYDYEYSHEFDPEEYGSMIDVKVRRPGGRGHYEYKNYRLSGIVKYHLDNDSIEENKVPDHLCDLDVDGLTVYDLSDPNVDAIKLDKCPDDLEKWLDDNLLEHISDD